MGRIHPAIINERKFFITKGLFNVIPHENEENTNKVPRKDKHDNVINNQILLKGKEINMKIKYEGTQIVKASPIHRRSDES